MVLWCDDHFYPNLIALPFEPSSSCPTTWIEFYWNLKFIVNWYKVITDGLVDVPKWELILWKFEHLFDDYRRGLWSNGYLCCFINRRPWLQSHILPFLVGLTYYAWYIGNFDYQSKYLCYKSLYPQYPNDPAWTRVDAEVYTIYCVRSKSNINSSYNYHVTWQMSFVPNNSTYIL